MSSRSKRKRARRELEEFRANVAWVDEQCAQVPQRYSDITFTFPSGGTFIGGEAYVVKHDSPGGAVAEWQTFLAKQEGISYPSAPLTGSKPTR